MSRKRSVRSMLYRDARMLGNIEAAAQGPTAFARRVVRRKAYAKANGLTRKLLRAFGLSR
jgi:hypothetical protein